ncbi:MAG: DUF5684 domain-containing protein [Actinomycetes bacterium]
MTAQSVAFGLVVYLLYAAPWCFVFAKAGKRWWVALLPVINLLVIIKIAARPWWWVLLLFVPVVGIAVWTVICLDVAERFGHGVPVAVGLVFLPFVVAIWLGLGPDAYVRGSAPVVAEVVPSTAESEPTAETEPTAESAETEPTGESDETGPAGQRIGAGE